MSLSCTISEILLLISQNFKRLHYHNHAHYGVVCHPKTTNLICHTYVQNLTAVVLDVAMNGVPKFKICHMTMIMPT